MDVMEPQTAEQFGKLRMNSGLVWRALADSGGTRWLDASCAFGVGLMVITCMSLMVQLADTPCRLLAVHMAMISALVVSYGQL